MRPRADLLIRKARIIDPATHRDEVADLLVEKGRLTRIGASLDAPGVELINGEGLWLIPGIIDSCIHLPEPGNRYAGTIASETRAAASGGVTHLCAMPDTNPPVDSTAVVRLIRDRARQAGFARLLPLAAMTLQQEGLLLSEMQTLKDAGCIGVTNGDQPLADNQILKRCLDYAATFDLPVIFRPSDAALSARGCAHEGHLATRLGLAGIPPLAETLDIARALLMIEATGVRAHFHQISSAQSIPLLRQAKEKGLPITADVSIHHLLLDENAIEGFNSLCHLRPPLRASADRDSLLTALAEGTLDAICSQHTPLTSSAKLAPFAASRPGISGVETLLSLTLKLVEENHLTLTRALDALTQAPARCMSIDAGRLETGRLANLVLLDPRVQYTPADDWVSAGHNSPWMNTKLPGKAQITLCEGKVTWLALDAERSVAAPVADSHL